MSDQSHTVEFQGQTYVVQHGNPFDRGAADSYYGRPRAPHRGGVGGESGDRSQDLTAQEQLNYLAGYDYNEEQGDKKEW